MDWELERPQNLANVLLQSKQHCLSFCLRLRLLLHTGAARKLKIEMC